VLGERNINITITVSTQKMAVGVAKANAHLFSLNKTTTNLNKTVGRVLRTMTAFAALFAARAFIRGIGESVKAFSQFEQGIANINILLDESDSRIGIFRETIRSLAKEFGVTTQDLLKAGFDIQSAIGDVSTSLDVLNAATRGAVAGGSKVADTTAGLLTLMESYGDKLNGAADAMDLLLLAQKFARANIGELSTSVSKFLPIASQMGVRVEELFAVYAQLTRALGNTREASTALGMFLNKLLKPTGKMIALAKREWNMSIQRAIATKGLVEVLKVLTQVQIEELGTLISRQRAIKAVTSLTKDMGKVSGWVTDMLEREGYTQELLAKQMNITERQMGQLREEWQDLMRVIGDITVQTGAIIYFRNLTKELNNMLSAIKKLRDEKEILEALGEKEPPTPIPPFLALIFGKPKETLSAFKNYFGSLRKVIRTEIEKVYEEIGVMTFDIATVIKDQQATMEMEDLFPLPSMEEFTSFFQQQADIGTAIQDETIRKTLQKEADKLLTMESMFKGYLDKDINANFQANQQKLEQYQFMIETMKQAHASLWSVAGKLRDTFSSGVSSMFKDMIRGTFDAKKAFSDLGFKMIDVLIDFAAQAITSMTLMWAMMKLFGPAAKELAKDTAIYSWGAAVGVGLGAYHGGMGASSAGLNWGFENPMKELGFQKGGIVPGVGRGDKVPAMLEPGELVVSRDKVNRITNNNNPSVVVNINGGLMVDDPNTIETLYREHIRDRIMTDIRTGRDNFYG